MNGRDERATPPRTPTQQPASISARADDAVGALLRSLSRIDTGKPSRVVPLPGHYASVLRIDEERGIAFGADGVGTKMVLAERLGRFETIGIDCIAMNVNDLVCVGAEPIALRRHDPLPRRRRRA